MRYKPLAISLGGLLGALIIAGGVSPRPVANACAIDGVPSLRADDARAVLNRTPPTRRTIAHWAPFIFARRFAVGQPIRFGEDMRELARTLPPEIVHGRWIWLLGDGSRAGGQTVRHRYARPGVYLITVSIALPHGSRTFTFDAALVQIGS